MDDPKDVKEISKKNRDDEDAKILRELEQAESALKKDEESAKKNKDRIRKLLQEKRAKWVAYVGEELAKLYYEKHAEDKIQFTKNIVELIEQQSQNPKTEGVTHD